MSAALAYETRVRQELPRILREVREPAKVIAFKTGCTPRTVEAIRQNEHGVSIGTLFAMANQYPAVAALVRELLGDATRDHSRILLEIQKLVSK